MKSSGKLTQSKITAFCSAAAAAGGGEGEGDEGDVARGRKRKNELEVCEVDKTPMKRVKSPDLFCSLDCNFDDFENDPFLSPKLKTSPKKSVLTESSAENEIQKEEKPNEIDFQTPVKCQVVELEFSRGKQYELILLLVDKKSNKSGVCKLRDVWTSCPISEGDAVCVQASLSTGDWVVDNRTGYIILYPDMILSSTTLTGAMFCLRQGILSSFFKEIDSEGNSRMLVGRLIHELFQESLKTSDENLQKIADGFLHSRGNLVNFFFSNLSTSEIQKEIRFFIPRIRKFLDVYIHKRSEVTGKNFKGTIDAVVDIEELIKSPTLGCQGRVDVTAKVSVRNKQRITPLELKTGRATFSKEHRSQVILYILLMNELGREVESGLLLYLREDILEEISPKRDEIRNLLLLRNQFVKFSRVLGNFPDPIRNAKVCTKCSYLRICTSYLENLSDSHPLKNIQTPDIKPSHVEYFINWNKMLQLEYEEVFQETPENQEMTKLLLQPNIESYKNEYKHTFNRTTTTKPSAFKPGTLIHVMNGKHNRITTGQIIELTDSTISILTDQKLTDFSDVYTFSVFKSKILYFNLTNLGLLLNEEYKGLRELIIEKRKPRFVKQLDKSDFEKCIKYLLNLNKEQQKAILKSLLCEDYLLIKGPPGTGKTQTILSLVRILLALGKKILIASHTHSSVDNILLKLKDVEYLRLGSLKSIRREMHKNSFGVLIENCSSVNDVSELFERKLIASTCMGIESDFVRKMKFDYCVIDESSQVLQPEILRPLFCCEKFVLVGDEDQLPPIVRNLQAKAMGMSVSLFESLSGDVATVRLKLQYRMNSVINSLANLLTYGGLIECANEEVAKATLRVSTPQEEDEWIAEALSPDLHKSVVFIDTSEYFNSKSPKLHDRRVSTLEANIILKLITSLVNLGVKEENIGLIAPFWDQITLLNTKLQHLQQIEINTVDQYQGRDKEVILLSCTKENQTDTEATELELLNDHRRLTVAVTRAKYKLIIVGDKKTIVKYKPFKKLIESLTETQVLSLSNGVKEFYWEKYNK